MKDDYTTNSRYASPIHCSSKGCENVFFELGSERVKRFSVSRSWSDVNEKRTRESRLWKMFGVATPTVNFLEQHNERNCFWLFFIDKQYRHYIVLWSSHGKAMAFIWILSNDFFLEFPNQSHEWFVQVWSDVSLQWDVMWVVNSVLSDIRRFPWVLRHYLNMRSLRICSQFSYEPPHINTWWIEIKTPWNYPRTNQLVSFFFCPPFNFHWNFGVLILTLHTRKHVFLLWFYYYYYY